ncbi:hypothetical protein M9Y10_019009 [Tritrichomonas musculus]|uniref:Viral A-type inclusion protein n=1 Tax=Tritrichomonas musculus TaxID=1915356 RepID=A0ABR2HID4_9EUKA
MWDSVSELGQSSKSIGQESDIEAQIVAESRTAQLQEQNEQLVKENASLQAQYEQAISLTSQIEELHQKNRQLSTDLRQSRSENENLIKRLDISQKLNEDLKQKLETEKQTAQSVRNADLITSQKEMQKIKDQSKAQLDEIYSQMDKIKQTKDQNDMVIKMMNCKIEKILDSAAHFFETKFANSDDLISFFSQVQSSGLPAQPAPSQKQFTVATTIPTPCNNNNQDQANLEKKLKHERSKVKTLKQDKAHLESNISKLQHDIHELKLRHEKEITQLTQKAKEAEENQALADAQKNHTISSLQSKIDSLTTKLSQERKKSDNSSNAGSSENTTISQVPSQPISQLFQPPPPAVSTNLPRADSNFGQKKELNTATCPASEHLINQNIELNTKIQTTKKRCDDLNSQLHAAQQKYADLEIAFNKQKNEYNSLSILHKDTCAELDLMRKTLHERESAKGSDYKMLKREYQSQKALVQNLTSQLESQKTQITELTLGNQQSIHTIENQNTNIADLKQELRIANDEIQKVRDDLITAQAELEGKKDITPDQILPDSAFTSTEFPAEVNSSIDNLARNPSLQPKSKIQNIYKLINKYFSDIVKARDTALDNAFTENQKISNEVNQFLINLSIALEMEPITFNDFVVKHSEQKIVDTINSMRTCHSDLKRKNEQLSQIVCTINRTFNIGSIDDSATALADIECQIATVKNQLTTTTDKLTKRTKKCHELSASLKSIKKKAEADAENSSTTIKRLTEASTDLKKQNEELVQSNQKMRWDLQNLNSKYQDFKQLHDETVEELQEKIASLQKAAEQEKIKFENEINEQAKIVNEQYGILNDAIAKQGIQINEFKRQIESHKATIAEKEYEIKQIHENHQSQQQSTHQQSSDKAEIIENYDRAVSELRQQCDTQRLDIEKMSKVLASTEKKLKQAKDAIIQLKKDKMKIESDNKILQEQNERQKKLNETTSKVALLTAQTEYNTLLDKEKSKIEDERRRMYGQVADIFKQFINPHETLNEKSFKSTIMKARDELSRLSSLDSAVRRMVNAERCQKTDDAVAQVMMRIA